MELENVQIKVVRCRFKELMVVIGLLVVDVIKVCVSNANLKKWFHTIIIMTVISIWLMFMEAIGDEYKFDFSMIVFKKFIIICS